MRSAEQIRAVHRELAEVAATATSDDGLIVATAGPTGALRELRLDPRVYRSRDAEALAGDILDTVRSAANSAERAAFDVAEILLPAHADPDDVDLAIDPVLGELDRLPAAADGVDYGALRRTLRALRDRVPDLTATADSEDGLVTATVDGRGRLVDLELDARIYRGPDSRALAERIGATARLAAARAEDQAGALAAALMSDPMGVVR